MNQVHVATRLLHHHYLAGVPGLSSGGWDLRVTSLLQSHALVDVVQSLFISAKTRDTVASVVRQLHGALCRGDGIELPEGDEAELTPITVEEHAMQLMLRRQADGTYSVMLFNTGTGVGNHHQGDEGKALAYWGFTDVPASSVELLTGNWFREVGDLDSVQEFYDQIAEICVEGNPIPEPDSPLHLQMVQVADVCAWAVNEAVLRRAILAQEGDASDNFMQYKMAKAVLDSVVWDQVAPFAADPQASRPSTWILAFRRVCKTGGDLQLGVVASDPELTRLALTLLRASEGNFSSDGERFVALKEATRQRVQFWLSGAEEPSDQELRPALAAYEFHRLALSLVREQLPGELYEIPA
jgi:hypothetical protein